MVDMGDKVVTTWRRNYRPYFTSLGLAESCTVSPDCLYQVSDFPTGCGSGGSRWGCWWCPCLQPICTSRPRSFPLLSTHGSRQANFSPTRDCASSTKVRTGLFGTLHVKGPMGPTEGVILRPLVSVAPPRWRQKPYFFLCSVHLEEWTNFFRYLDSREAHRKLLGGRKGGGIEIPVCRLTCAFTLWSDLH